MNYKRQYKGQHNNALATGSDFDDFILEKDIFSSIFDKDIRRVFIYKKAERLAKAIHLIAPAFHNAPALRNRADTIAMGMIDTAILFSTSSKRTLARELLALSSVLSIARTSGMLSVMNAELIEREAHMLLQEVVAYEEPNILLEEDQSFAQLLKKSSSQSASRAPVRKDALRTGARASMRTAPKREHHPKGRSDVKDSRKEAILSIIRAKGHVYIKDISIAIRDVSEKTIQRELADFVSKGVLVRIGNRRWTSYTLA